MEADIILRLAQLLNLPTPPNYNQESVYFILTKSADYIEFTKARTPGSNGNRRKDEVVQKAKALESELKVSITSVEASENLKSKTEKLSGLFKKERDKNGVLEEFILSQKQKIDLLVEHVEKLVQFLKVESHLKNQAVIKSKELLKAYEALENKCEVQVRKINAQNRVIAELNEGSKILDDQLKLMDEKFMELRSKMDNSRAIYMKETNKLKKNFSELRLKYALTHHGELLDSVRLPRSSTDQLRFSKSDPALTTTMSNDAFLTSTSNNNPTITTMQSQRSSKNEKKPSASRPLSASYSGSSLPEGPAFSTGIKGGNTTGGPLRPLSASATRLTATANSNSIGRQKPSEESMRFDALLEEPPSDPALSSILKKINRKDSSYKKVWSSDELNSLIKAGDV